MKTKDLISAFEALLFSSGEPLSIDRISNVFEITPEKVVSVMDALQEKLDENESGVELLRLENTYQLATRPFYAEYIKKAFDIRRKTPLSSASLEVLAVIAYNQPVTKAFIEQVRGVDCSSVVTNLIDKELIEERGRLELPGKPLLYGTTKNFLRCFSLNDLTELPPLPDSQPEVNDVGEQLTLSDDNVETAMESGE